jgi:DNA-binding response OmpR family regulator
MRILIVEDDPHMASALKTAFGRHNLVADHVDNSADAILVLKDGVYDAILLDRQLPDGDGLSMIPKLRNSGTLIPIIVLTAKGQVPDRINGLETGADDYVAKPFDFDELLARLRAVMRRPGLVQSQIVSVGRLTFDLEFGDALVAGKRLEMPRRERLVLESLVRRVGRMVPRPAMMEAVFGYDDEIQSNSLDSHISRLRRKLADAQAGTVINVIRGVGYMLREEP